MKLSTLALGSVVALTVIGCNGGDKSTSTDTSKPGSANSAMSGTGKLSIDGSGTVYPVASLMAEDFAKENKTITVSVNKAGTGSGFKKFIDGSIDIATASRTIEEKEEADCKAKGIEFIEIPIAYDGISIIVNKENKFANNLTVDEIKKIFGEGSTAMNWSDVHQGWPAEKMMLTGPSDNHGTYEFFTEKGLGKKNAIRKEYQAQQEYNTIIQAVEGDKNGIGYLGYSFYAENKDKVNLVSVDGIAATPETIANGTYKPLGRTLFLYVNKKAMDRPGVKEFLDYALSKDGLSAVTERQYVLLSDEAYDLVRERLKAGKVGSIFRTAAAGSTTVDILKAAK